MKEKIKKFIVKNLKWIVLFICLIGFFALAEDVFNKEIMNGDIVGYKLVSTFLISDFATPIAKFITNFGGAIILIGFAISRKCVRYEERAWKPCERREKERKV